MSKFLREVTKTYEFDGDTVSVSFRRMSQDQYLLLAPFLPREADEQGNAKVTPEESMRVIVEASKFLPDLVTKFEGLQDANGEPIELEVALSEVYFMVLVGKIIADIITVSFLQGDEGKNLPRQPVASSTGLDCQAPMEASGD